MPTSKGGGGEGKGGRGREGREGKGREGGGPTRFLTPSGAYGADVPCWGLLRTSDVDTRRSLRSADTAMLVIPSIRRSMLGDHAFPVALARAWNRLPSSVRNAPLLTTFSRELKTVLFRSSFDND